MDRKNRGHPFPSELGDGSIIRMQLKLFSMSVFSGELQFVIYDSSGYYYVLKQSENLG